MRLLLLSLLLFSALFVSPAFSKGNFDLTFNLGPSITENGNIADLGDPNLSTGFGFNFFFNKNHGIGFGYNNESSYEGTRKFPEINNGSISTFDLHYAYRFIMNKFHLVIEPGIGRQTLYDQSTDYYWGYVYNDDLSTALVLNYKIFARYVITEWDPDGDATQGYFFAGGGIIHNFSFDDDYRGEDISGNRLAALFQIGLGW